jgi:hypothetical protein
MMLGESRPEDAVSRRRSVVLQLAAEPVKTAGLTRPQRIAALRSVADAARHQVLEVIERYVRRGVPIEVANEDTIFPVLTVTASPEIIAELAKVPGVEHIVDAPEVAVED